MPVRKLNCAIDILRRCCEKPRMTARPRAREVMKLGSPESAAIVSDVVGAASADSGSSPRRDFLAAALFAGFEPARCLTDKRGFPGLKKHGPWGGSCRSCDVNVPFQASGDYRTLIR